MQSSIRTCARQRKSFSISLKQAKTHNIAEEVFSRRQSTKQKNDESIKEHSKYLLTFKLYNKLKKHVKFVNFFSVLFIILLSTTTFWPYNNSSYPKTSVIFYSSITIVYIASTTIISASLRRIEFPTVQFCLVSLFAINFMFSGIHYNLGLHVDDSFVFHDLARSLELSLLNSIGVTPGYISPNVEFSPLIVGQTYLSLFLIGVLATAYAKSVLRDPNEYRISDEPKSQKLHLADLKTRRKLPCRAPCNARRS